MPGDELGKQSFNDRTRQMGERGCLFQEAVDLQQVELCTGAIGKIRVATAQPGERGPGDLVGLDLGERGNRRRARRNRDQAAFAEGIAATKHGQHDLLANQVGGADRDLTPADEIGFITRVALVEDRRAGRKSHGQKATCELGQYSVWERLE